MLSHTALSDTLSAKSKSPRSTLISRNVTISGHRTSIRLEPEMWSGLSEICRREGGSLHEVCTAVSARKGEDTSLTAAIRVFVMTYYRSASTEDGHSKAGHGYGMATLNTGGEMHRAAPVTAPMSSSTASPSYGGMTSRTFSMNGGSRGNSR